MRSWRFFLLHCFFSLTAQDVSMQKQESVVTFSGELLYWRPAQSEMTYCILEKTTTFSNVYAAQNSERAQKGDWGLGFRVGGGIEIGTIPIDVTGYWTRFSHTMHASTETDQIIFGSQLFFGGDGLALGGNAVAAGPARSRWILHVNLVELATGYWMHFNKHFWLRSYVGVEGGWLHQKQIIDYEHFLDTNTNPPSFFNATITQKNHFAGIGPLIGLDGQFHFGYGLGLDGKLATSLLYGSEHSPFFLYADPPMSQFPFTNASFKYSLHRILPAVQSRIGLHWFKHCSRRVDLLFRIAYEVQYFWGTWRIQSSGIQTIAAQNMGYGDLSLQGVTGQVQLSF
jgi:hypothetical protein